MSGWSKAVGAGLGYCVGGPIGAVLGYMAGDKLAPRPQAAEGHLLIANLFGFTTLFLKCSTTPTLEVRKETIHFISRLFRFDAADECVAEELLHRLLAVDLDISAMARTFKNHSDVSMRLRVLDILATLCLLIHCPLEKSQIELLAQIAQALNLSSGQWQAIKSRYQARSPTLDPACCYALLETYPELSNSKIKAAYRRLAKKYHPDLVAQLDPAVLQRYVERMTLVNAAYETVRSERGF